MGAPFHFLIVVEGCQNRQYSKIFLLCTMSITLRNGACFFDLFWWVMLILRFHFFLFMSRFFVSGT